MAKITHKGMWIDVSSLNPTDKKNYVSALVFFIIASLFLGIHLGHIGIFGAGPPPEPVVPEPALFITRALMIIFFFIGAFFYGKFYSKQDDLFKLYHNTVLAGGGYGFMILGLFLTILSPYFNFQPTFYEFFLAFTAGTIIGGYYFHRKYISQP